MNTSKIIFLEFNELCPTLLRKFMSEGRLPNFKRFYDDSEVYTTESDEKSGPYLEPWIQWYSMHTGLPYDQHKVFHLTDGPKADHPDIWRILLAEGKKVMNCSSMNARAFQSEGSFFLPDPWCTTEKAYPPDLQPFHNVVARQVQQYSNTEQSLSRSDYSNFLSFLLSHGFRMKTAVEILRQLVKDRLDKGESWRRAVLLDKLQFDVFRYYFRKLQPDFSTFFLNSTAHYQHSYWRHMAPEEFSVQPTEEERRRYGGAILFGYQSMDKLLGDFFRLAGNDATLILATAISQQPFLKREGAGGQHFYRPKDFQKLLESLGIHTREVLPVMTHQFLLSFAGQSEAESAQRKIEALTCMGKQVFDFAPSNPGTLYVGCQIYSSLVSDVKLDLGNGSSTPFFDVFYPMGALKSGCHHPDGVFWVKSGKHKVNADKISILEVLPMLLKYFDTTPNRRNAAQAAGSVL
jgi:hypothetical protein